MKEFILRRPLTVVAAILGLTAALGLPASRVSIDPSVEGMILDDDPGRLYYERFVGEFGSDEILVVRVRTPRLFEREVLEAIARVSDAIGAIRIEDDTGASRPVIDRVIGLTNVPRIESARDEDGGGVLDVSPLLAELPTSAAEVRALRERATSDPLYVGNLLSSPRSSDSDEPLSALILARASIWPDDLVYRTTLADRVREILAQEEARTPALRGAFLVAGVPILKAEIGRETERETATAQIAVWAVILVALMTMFPVRLPGLFVIASILSVAVWTVGFMVLCGGRINVLSAVILPLVRIIAMTTAIHILSRYYMEARSSRSPREVVGETLEKVTLPCFLAAFTTAVGFLALTTSDIVAVRELGLFAGLGVMSVWVVVNGLLPALLMRVPLASAERRSLIVSQRIDAMLDTIARGVIRHRIAILVAFVASLGIVALGIAKLKVSTDLLAYFPSEHPVSRAYHTIADEIGAAHPLDITIRAAPGAALDPVFLSRVKAFQTWLDAQPEVDLTVSVLDYLDRLNQEFHGGDPAHARLPENAEQAASLLFLLEAGAATRPVEALLHPGWEEAETLRISVRIRTLDTEEILALIARIERRLAQQLGARAEVDPPSAREALAVGDVATRVTGVVSLYADMASAVVDGQITSMGLAFVVIWLIVVLVTRSVRVGTLAMLPNLLPTLAVLAIMGFSGVSLNIGTAMIAAIALGIAVDDTIHFLMSYGRGRADGSDARAAVRLAMREVGRPIALTTVIMASGFLVSSLIPSFAPVAQFQLFGGLAIVLALLADLTLLPALLVSFRAPGGEEAATVAPTR